MRWQTFLVAAALSSASSYVVRPPPGLAADGVPDSRPRTRSVMVGAPRAPYVTQGATFWCWAASVANVFRFAGHPVSQARVVREVYGDAVNMRSGPAANVAALLDRAWVDDAGEAFRARVVGLFDAAAGRFGVDGREVVDSLRAGRPLVLGTSSHAMLLLGVSYRESGAGVTLVGATVFDPWPGVGVRALRPDELRPPSQHGSLAFIADVVVARSRAGPP